jgi:hypothetical protein
MPHIQINTSCHGTPGEVVAVEDGEVVWAGPIDALDEAGSFDALFCHDDDENRLLRLSLSREAEESATGGASAKPKAK